MCWQSNAIFNALQCNICAMHCTVPLAVKADWMNKTCNLNSSLENVTIKAKVKLYTEIFNNLLLITSENTQCVSLYCTFLFILFVAKCRN